MNLIEKYFLNFSLSLDHVALLLRSGRITQYIWLAPAVARPIFAFLNKIIKVEKMQTSDILNVR
jgi:hypothetical protein